LVDFIFMVGHWNREIGNAHIVDCQHGPPALAQEAGEQQGGDIVPSRVAAQRARAQHRTASGGPGTVPPAALQGHARHAGGARTGRQRRSHAMQLRARSRTNCLASAFRPPRSAAWTPPTGVIPAHGQGSPCLAALRLRRLPLQAPLRLRRLRLPCPPSCVVCPVLHPPDSVSLRQVQSPVSQQTLERLCWFADQCTLERGRGRAASTG